MKAKPGCYGCVYLISHPDGFLKIGFTRSLAKRMISAASSSTWPTKREKLTLLYIIPRSLIEKERKILHRFNHLRLKPGCEWFVDSHEIREWFRLNGIFFVPCFCGSWIYKGRCVDEYGEHRRVKSLNAIFDSDPVPNTGRWQIYMNIAKPETQK